MAVSYKKLWKLRKKWRIPPGAKEFYYKHGYSYGRLKNITNGGCRSRSLRSRGK